MFHVDVFNLSNQYELLGGAKTCALGLTMGCLSLAYFMGGRAAKGYHFYVDTHNGAFRFALGTVLGLGLGYNKWGDRQKVHNAYVAEKLRRRYPTAMNLGTHDLWQFKGVAASHSFYQWR